MAERLAGQANLAPRQGQSLQLSLQIFQLLALDQLVAGSFRSQRRNIQPQ